MQQNLPSEIVWSIIAIAGGIAKYLDRYLRKEEVLDYKRIISTVFVAGFTGWMAAEIVLLMYPNWAIIAAGVGGYSGTQIMDEIVKILKLRLQITDKDLKENDRKSSNKHNT